MSRQDLAQRVFDEVAGLNKKQAAAYVDMVLDLMAQTLCDGEVVKLSGFGQFIPRDKAARVGRNPRTMEEKVISARRVVTFKASPNFKKAVAEAKR